MSLKFPVKFSPSYPLADICFQDWSPLCAEVVFTRGTFHSKLRKTDVFRLKPGAPKWNKERPKTAMRRYGLQQKGFYNLELLHT